MIEYITIFFSSLILSIILFTPINKIFFLKKLHLEKSVFDYNVINLLIFSNLIIIFKILKIKISVLVSISYIFFSLNCFFLEIFKKEFFNTQNIIYFIFFYLVLFILSIDIAYNLTLGWDAQSTWFPRVISFYNDEYLTEVSKYARHPEYPIFGSLSWAFFWKFFYIDKEYFGRFFYLLIFLISIFNFIDLLRISLIKKIIISLSLILLIYDYWHFRGYQEILIFSFILIISKYLYFIICEKKTDKEYLFIILITSNLIIWTKNEGNFFCSFIYLILSIFSKYNIKIKVINFTLFLTLILIRFLIYEYYELQVNLQDNYDFNNLIKIFFGNIQYANISLILKHIFLTVFKFPIILFSLIFILYFEKIKFKKILFLYFYLILNLFFIFAIYLSTNKSSLDGNYWIK